MNDYIEEYTIKVTSIKGNWHCRLFRKGVVVDEMACANRIDIGYCCRDMLRWVSKGGGMSRLADASRKRQKRGPYGPVKYHKHLTKG